MKKVALFAHNLTVEYALNVAQGAAAYYTKDKDVQLILAQTNQPHYPYGLYEYQYWASAEILKSDDIDLIMIITSTETIRVSTYLRLPSITTRPTIMLMHGIWSRPEPVTSTIPRQRITPTYSRMSIKRI